MYKAYSIYLYAFIACPLRKLLLYALDAVESYFLRTITRFVVQNSYATRKDLKDERIIQVYGLIICLYFFGNKKSKKGEVKLIT